MTKPPEVENIEVENIELLDVSDALQSAQETRDKLAQEIESLQKELGIAGDEIGDGGVDSFMTRSWERMNKASLAAKELENPTHRKTPEEVQKLLDNLTREHDRFFLNMKIAQMQMVQDVISGYEKIQQEKDQSKITEHTEALRNNLDSLSNMPSPEEFDAQNAEIAKMAGTYPLVANLNPNDQTAARTLAAGISKAYRDNAKTFGRFIKTDDVEQTAELGEELENTAGNFAFVGLVSKGLRESFSVAKAVTDGKVKLEENTADKAIYYLGLAVSAVPIPIIPSVANGLLSVASQVNLMKRMAEHRNVAGFATDEEKLRGDIVDDVASKVYSAYSGAKTNGYSPLDVLNDSGKEKFAAAIVQRVISEIANFKAPEGDEIPRLDDEKFKSDPKYREGLVKKFGVEVDATRLGEDTYFNDIATQLETKMYVNLVSDRLVGSVMNGHSHSIMSRSDIDILASDLVPGKSNQNLTIDGLLGRVGIVTADGQRYLSSYRDESAKGGSKYGFRLATAEEEKLIAEGKGIEGYQRFEDPNLKELEERKKAVTDILKPKDFKEDNFQLADDLIASYRKWREENPKLDHEKFLKNSAINSGGKSSVGLFGRVRDEAREHFNNDLKKPLIAMLEAVDKVRLDVQVDGKNEGHEIVESEEEMGEHRSSFVNPLQTISGLADVVRKQFVGHGEVVKDEKNTKREEILKHQQTLESKIKGMEGAKKWRPLREMLTQMTGGLYPGGTKETFEKEDQEIENLKNLATVNAKSLTEIDRQSKAAEELAKNFDEARGQKTKPREAVGVEKMITQARSVVDVVEVQDHVVEAAHEKEKSEQQKSKAQEQALKILEGKAHTARALKDGKVGMQDDSVDMGILAAGTIIGSVPLFGSFVAKLVTATATKANQARKEKNNEGLVTFVADKEKSKQVITDLVTTVYDYYSGRPGVESALANLSENGQKKFISHIVSAAIDQIAKDPTKADDVNGLIGSMIGGSNSSKIFESMSKVRFEKDDLAPGKRDEKLTMQGLLGRVGIVTADGRQFLSQGRKESAQGESKYGFRKATPEEEAAITEGKGIAGYKQYEKESARTSSSKIKISTTKDGDVFARINSTPDRNLEEMAELKKFDQSQVARRHVAENIKSAEGTDVISSTASYAASMIGWSDKKSPGQKVGEKDEFTQKLEAVAKQVRNKDSVSLVTGFVEGYHAKVMDGASKEELVEFAKEKLGGVTKNQLVQKQLVDLAVDYSEARIEKANVKRVALSEEVRKLEDDMRGKVTETHDSEQSYKQKVATTHTDDRENSGSRG
ncbi:MAG: hypothetical protein FJX34_02415 [Alphaproteobacteria bacterium]|nr:hypothetical protein [Alphaproteobacteria bacterium]